MFLDTLLGIFVERLVPPPTVTLASNKKVFFCRFAEGCSPNLRFSGVVVWADRIFSPVPFVRMPITLPSKAPTVKRMDTALLKRRYWNRKGSHLEKTSWRKATTFTVSFVNFECIYSSALCCFINVYRGFFDITDAVHTILSMLTNWYLFLGSWESDSPDSMNRGMFTLKPLFLERLSHISMKPSISFVGESDCVESTGPSVCSIYEFGFACVWI